MASKIKFEETVSPRASNATNDNIEDLTRYDTQDYPPTPPGILSKYEIPTVPYLIPDIADLNLPIVREVGVKSSILLFADILGFNKQRINLIQFWFIDILTDCLWRCQDEFQFPDKEQKVILEWMVYIFNMLRDPGQKFSRRQLIQAFKEALKIAEDFILSGCTSLPNPENLFYIKFGHDDEDCGSSNSSFSEKSLDDNDSLLVMKVGEEMKSFPLPSKVCYWDEEDECLSSSVESVSEDECSYQKDETLESVSSESFDEEMDFYKPDLRTPARFVSSSEVVADSSSISFDNTLRVQSSDASDLTWMGKSPTPRAPCPSEILQSVTETMKHEDEIFQAWYAYYLWQTQKEFMADAKKGSTTPFPDNKNPKMSESPEELTEWDTFLNHCMELSKETNRNIFKNTGVLMAIKQFFFDYFFESFQFKILVLAFRYQQYYVAQQVNPDWCIPKQFKGLFKSPIPRMPKKTKPVKPKKDKPDKKAKHKNVDEKTKVKKSGDKKGDKKTGDKKSEKNEAKDKKKKVQQKEEAGPSKEEKARLLREQKEADRIAEEMLKEEEHRIFMFPLADAVNDRFFEGIFEDWTKPKRGKKGKEDKHNDDMSSPKDKGKDKGADKSSKGSKKRKNPKNKK